jgi:hypothetical protein
MRRATGVGVGLGLAAGLVAGFVIAVAAGASPTYDTNLDPMKVAPDQYTLKLDNDKVRVLEYHSHPGQKEGMHSHPAVVLIVTKGGIFRSTTPDGKVTDTTYKGGEVIWRGAITHSGENVGTTDLESYLIQLK